MKKMSEHVSIITPVYNCAAYLEETAATVLGQTCQDWEWLITDDCSRDGSWDLVQELCRRDPRVKAVRQPENLGAAAARNRSLDRARGRYVAFLDADDAWLPEKLERHLAFVRARGAGMSFTAYEIVDQFGQTLGKVVDGRASREVVYEDMLRKRATMGCSTVIVRRDVMGGLRMPDLRTGQDYAFWLMLLKQGGPAVGLPVPLTRYRVRPGSISRNKLGKARRQWQIYRECEGMGLAKSVRCFGQYAWRAVFR